MHVQHLKFCFVIVEKPKMNMFRVEFVKPDKQQNTGKRNKQRIQDNAINQMQISVQHSCT